jgi:hypothetical protein
MAKTDGGSPEVEVKDDKTLVVKLDIPEGALASALADGVRSTLIAGATQYIISQITPEMLNQFVAGILGDALKDLGGYRLREPIAKLMDPMIVEFLKRPEVQAFMRRKVEEGINAAIEQLPEKVKEALISRAIQGMTKAWER